MIYMYTVDPSAETPIMLINKHIGYDEESGVGIMGDQFQQELLALDAAGKRNVHVWITSEGGSVLEGEKIYSTILNAKCKVDTYCMGLAASTAAWIFQAGRKRVMADYGKLMFHNTYGGSSDLIKVYNDTIATMVSQRTGRDKSEVSKMMDKTTWILAQEAKDNGFCDEVMLSSEANRGRLSRITNDLAFWKTSVEVVNSILNKDKTMNLSKVCNRLNLVEGSNEDAILAAIEKIQNNAASEINELKNSLKTTTETNTKLEAELKETKNTLEVQNKAKEAAEKEALKVKAKDLVNSYGDRVKAENKESLIEKASKSEDAFTNVKEILEALPLNKVAPKFENNGGDFKLGSVVATTMAETRNKLNL